MLKNNIELQTYFNIVTLNIIQKQLFCNLINLKL